MQSKARNFDEYLAEAPAERQTALATLRKLILTTVPSAKETMRYGMPTYSREEIFCALASQKHYMALYCGEGVLKKYRSKLSALDCGKGCIRFRHLEDLPLDVIQSMIRDAAKHP